MPHYSAADMERLKREELDSLAFQQFKVFVRHIKKTVPFYREKLKDVDVEEIRDPEDIASLPFTTKAELRAAPLTERLGVDLDEVQEIHSSSGTTGAAVHTAYTRQDLGLWRQAMRRVLLRAGVGPSDIVHNAYGYGLFTGGLGIHYAALDVGAAVVPMSAGHTERQVLMLRDLGATVLTSTPSYAQHIAEAMCRMGIRPQDLKLRVGIFGAEPWSAEMCQELEDAFQIHALDIYGLAEIIGPGVASECVEGRGGMHIAEDLFYVEIVDPATGRPLPIGEKGELVLSAMTREATPVLRYRTGDITRLVPEPCPCGRTTRRIDHIQGRADDMFTLRGVNVFPKDIESVLFQCEELAPVFQLVLDRPAALDVLEVHVEPRAPGVGYEALGRVVQERLHRALGINAQVVVRDPYSLPRSEGKAIRLIDRRNLSR